MDAHVEKTVGLAPLPQWLKLTRKGNTLEGFYSFDGRELDPGSDSRAAQPAQ